MTLQYRDERSRDAASAPHAGNRARSGRVRVQVSWTPGPTAIPFCPHSRADGAAPCPLPPGLERRKQESLKRVSDKPDWVLDEKRAKTLTKDRTDVKL